MKFPFFAGVILLLVRFFLHHHFLRVLLCLEGLTLILVYGVSWLSPVSLTHMVFLFLVLGVAEAALGLSVLVSLSRASSSSKALL